MNDQNATGAICVRCFVAGRVQGVFFRASTRHEAQRLDIKGFARNLSDGRVEVVACGSAEAVDELKTWLGRGPADARVTGVSCEVIDQHNFNNFSIG
jgi:acylphosphatase